MRKLINKIIRKLHRGSIKPCKEFDSITVEEGIGVREATGTSFVLQRGHVTGILFGDYPLNDQ